MRKRIFEVVEAAGEGDVVSAVYDTVMLLCIFASLTTLAFKNVTAPLRIIDAATCIIFVIDYILRWVTADYKTGEKGAAPFLHYPFTFMAIVDLLSILPSVTLLSNTFKVFRVFRMIRVMRAMRVLRVLRVAKAARYSASVTRIINVFRRQKDALAAVGALAVFYILVAALIVFNVEPDTFDTFFDAVYWSCISLTSVGYGDIYPVTTAGRVVAMLSSLFGIAIVALPSGIITAGYMDELTRDLEKRRGGESEENTDTADGLTEITDDTVRRHDGA